MKAFITAAGFLLIALTSCDSPVPPPPGALPGVTDVGGETVINPAALEHCVRKSFTRSQVLEFCKVTPDIDTAEKPISSNILEFVGPSRGPVPDPVKGNYLAWMTIAEQPRSGYIVTYGISWDDGKPRMFRTETEFLGDPPGMPGPPRAGHH